MIEDIRTASPFWLMRNGFLHSYHTLADDVQTDFVIIGGGISGALLTWHLATKGASVVLADRQHIGMASTSASTSLLQYDIDRALHELVEIMGEKKACRAYELSLKALLDLEKIAKRLKCDDFEPRLSIRFAAFKKDVPFLEKEFRARASHGYDMELWDAAEVAKHFSFATPAALLTRPSAIADPYRLTHALLQDAIRHGARVFDKTGIEEIARSKTGVTLKTSKGNSIRAKKVVIACGYESIDYVPFKIGNLASTYALVSEPIPGKKKLWFENASFWDTGDPYIYGRTTTDNRIIFGGGDEPFYSPAKRDRLLNKKTDWLAARFRKMFPDIPLNVDYNWAGTFIETDDGLPYIGGIKQLPHTLYALGYGGNGITFSQLAGEIICDLLLGKENRDAEIFSFERKTD